MTSLSDLVSVITPMHNCSRFLSQTIESVLSQTYDNLELVIVDDCSTDDSLNMAAAYATKDSRIRLKSLKVQSGPAVARNTAIEMARGRFIAFLDSDDSWYPRKLELQTEFMRSKNVALSYTHYEKISEDGTRLGICVTPPSQLSYADMLKSNQIGCLTAVYDSHLLGKVFMPDLRKRQDYGLWLKILKSVPYAYCLPQCLAVYRVRSSSVSSNKLNLIKYNWALFRDVEKLSLMRSLYYLGWNIAVKIRN